MNLETSSRIFGGEFAGLRDRKRLSTQIERIRAWALARDWFTLRAAREDMSSSTRRYFFQSRLSALSFATWRKQAPAGCAVKKKNAGEKVFPAPEAECGNTVCERCRPRFPLCQRGWRTTSRSQRSDGRRHLGSSRQLATATQEQRKSVRYVALDFFGGLRRRESGCRSRCSRIRGSLRTMQCVATFAARGA